MLFIVVGVERCVVVQAITSVGLCKPVPSLASSIGTIVTSDVSSGSQTQRLVTCGGR